MTNESLAPSRLSVVVASVLQSTAWPIAHFVFRIFGRLHIEGRENLKGLQNGIIFAANHAHEMDPILMRALLPWVGKHSPMFYVARERVHYGWEGWREYIYGDGFFKAWGAYPAYKGLKNYESSLKHFLNILRKKHTVCIFPAGIKKKPLNEVHDEDVRGGVGFLAHTTGASVVPVLIEGTQGITWKDLYLFRRKLRIRIGEPKTFAQFNPSPSVEQCKTTAKEVWNDILHLRRI